MKRPEVVAILERLHHDMTGGEWVEDGLRGGLVNVWVPSLSTHICVVGDSREHRPTGVLQDAQGIAKLRNMLPEIIAALKSKRT